jgi:hypothetical protein
MNDKLMRKLRRREASTAVGPSTARGMGRKIIPAARKYLAELRVESFQKATRQEFEAVLDHATQRFVDHLPRGAKHWGAARKFLNIYLRNLAYNRFLCRHYKLNRILRWLEVPLDSQVAKELHKEAKKSSQKKLPRWKTVIGLNRETSRLYQDFAREVSRKKRISRVHLDILYWRRDFVDAVIR